MTEATEIRRSFKEMPFSILEKGAVIPEQCLIEAEGPEVLALYLSYEPRHVRVVSPGVDENGCPTLILDIPIEDVQVPMTEIVFHEHPGWNIHCYNTDKGFMHICLTKGHE